MRVRSLVALIAQAAFMTTSLQAIAQKPTEANTVLTMKFEEGRLVGEAAELLYQKLENAQFVMIGEEHGFSDPADIALAIAKNGRSHGLSTYVTEIGPVTDQLISSTLADEGVDGLAELLADHRYGIPFLNMQTDAELADYFLSEAEPGYDALWGVDQEFLYSSSLHFDTLLKLTPDHQAKLLLTRLVEMEKATINAGHEGDLFLNAAGPDDFRELRLSFQEVEEALEIIDALETSSSIYQSFASGQNLVSNTDRIAYMQSNFFEAYRSSEEAHPRALFKFGAVHMGLGTTFLNTFDLGSVTEGVAASNGLDILRLAILPLSGEQTLFDPAISDGFQTRNYRSEEVAGFLQFVGIEEATVPVDGYLLIDLEPIRQKLGQAGLNSLPPPAKYIVLGYDYIITTRGARHSRPLVWK